MSGKNSKIEELYISLSRQDKDGISSFLSCTLFNQSDIVMAMHLYLAEHLIQNVELDKMDLYRNVFPSNEKYSDVKLRVFISKLVKLIEKYIVVKKIDQYPLAELSILNNYYSLNHLHKNRTVFFNNKSETNFHSYEEFLTYEYAYAMRKLDYIFAEYSHDGDIKRVHFEEALQAQKKLSFFQTLKTQCDFLSFTQKYKSEKDTSYEDFIVNQLIDSRNDQDLVIRAYIYVYQVAKENNQQLFSELKDIVLNNHIPYETTYKALLSHLENFCIRFVNSGKREYLEQLFEIYKCEIQFFKFPGDLNSSNFRNIVNCALQLSHIEWAENFIETYNSKVSNIDQENNYNFNYARIYFEKGEYKSAMRQLLKVTYEDSFYASSARNLLIKCYYELNDEMPLLSCCGSLTQFYNRSKDFTKQRIENNLHFIKYVKILQKHRLENNRAYFKKLHQKVNESNLVQKEWLLKKIEALY
jgi:hypothetical protein